MGIIMCRLLCIAHHIKCVYIYILYSIVSCFCMLILIHQVILDEMNQWFIFGSIDSPVLLKPFKRDSIIKLTLKVKRVKWIVHLHLHLQACESPVDEVMKVFQKETQEDRWGEQHEHSCWTSWLYARGGGVRAASSSNHSRRICIFHNTSY